MWEIKNCPPVQKLQTQNKGKETVTTVPHMAGPPYSCTIYESHKVSFFFPLFLFSPFWLLSFNLTATIFSNDIPTQYLLFPVSSVISLLAHLLCSPPLPLCQQGLRAFRSITACKPRITAARVCLALHAFEDQKSVLTHTDTHI